MCWNQYVSINTFIFSVFVLILIAFNNKYSPYKIDEFDSIFVYIFFISFITMQLIEFFIWRNLKNKNINKIFSILGSFLLLIQPIASLLMLKNNKLKWKMVSIYGIPAFVYFIYQLKNHRFYTDVSKNGHLIWNWSTSNDKFLFFGFLFYLYFLMYSIFINGHYLLMIYSMLLLLASYYLYVKDKTVSSIWCWAVNTIMFIFAFKLLMLLPFREH